MSQLNSRTCTSFRLAASHKFIPWTLNYFSLAFAIAITPRPKPNRSFISPRWFRSNPLPIFPNDCHWDIARWSPEIATACLHGVRIIGSRIRSKIDRKNVFSMAFFVSDSIRKRQDISHNFFGIHGMLSIHKKLKKWKMLFSAFI
jgi:hypothetical protein